MNIKLIISLVAILLVPEYSISQDKYGSYESSYWQEIFNIGISVEDDSSFTLFIDVYSIDDFSEKGGVIVDVVDYQGFVKSFNDAYVKYNEWVQVAKENSVSELNKVMEFSCTVDAYFMFGSEWQMDQDVELTFQFLIHDIRGEKSYTLLVSTGELVSVENQYITSKLGLSFAFNTSKGLKDFIDEISVAKVREYIEGPKETDLFK